jgi:hypothetical protein
LALPQWVKKPEGAGAKVMAQRATIQRIAAIAAMLIASPIAYAEPVHLTCDGQILTANKRVLETDTKSLTIELENGVGPMGTVTFDGRPMSILPEPYPPDPDAKTGRPTLKLKPLGDSFVFIGEVQGDLADHGNLNRVTGQVVVQFKDGAAYVGTCKVARRLF